VDLRSDESTSTDVELKLKVGSVLGARSEVWVLSSIQLFERLLRPLGFISSVDGLKLTTGIPVETTFQGLLNHFRDAVTSSVLVPFFEKSPDERTLQSGGMMINSHYLDYQLIDALYRRTPPPRRWYRSDLHPSDGLVIWPPVHIIVQERDAISDYYVKDADVIVRYSKNLLEREFGFVGEWHYLLRRAVISASNGHDLDDIIGLGTDRSYCSRFWACGGSCSRISGFVAIAREGKMSETRVVPIDVSGHLIYALLDPCTPITWYVEYITANLYHNVFDLAFAFRVAAYIVAITTGYSKADILDDLRTYSDITVVEGKMAPARWKFIANWYNAFGIKMLVSFIRRMGVYTSADGGDVKTHGWHKALLHTSASLPVLSQVEWQAKMQAGFFNFVSDRAFREFHTAALMSCAIK